jgi:hypothetical protein
MDRPSLTINELVQRIQTFIGMTYDDIIKPVEADSLP